MCISTVGVAQIAIQTPAPKRSGNVYESFALFLILLLKTLWDVQDAPVHRNGDGDDGVSNQVELNSSP